MLSESEDWFIDGCFGNLPKFCKQIIQINCIHPSQKFAIPCAWIITNTKKTIMYQRMFAALKLSLKSIVNHDLDCETKPKTIMSDMEYSLQLALENSFPKSHLKSCYFHLVKAFWDYSKKVGLKKKSNYKFLHLFIDHFKIIVHIKESNLQKKLMDEIEAHFITENHFNLDESIVSKLIIFFNHLKQTYFSASSFFSKYINCRLIFLLSLKKILFDLVISWKKRPIIERIMSVKAFFLDWPKDCD